MNEEALLWRYDHLSDPVTAEEIEKMVMGGELAPSAFTWREEGRQSETYPASWHLRIWKTHPELGTEPPRSLFRLQLDEENGVVNDDTMIAATGETEGRPLGQFSWRVEIDLGLEEPESLSTAISREELSGWQWDVFISYSQKDSPAAEALQTSLEKRGLRVWRDDRLLDDTSSAFTGTISEAHDRAAKVIVLWSMNSVKSDWVHAEAERARMNDKVVPVALEDLDLLLADIPLPFNTLPTLSASAIARDAEPLLRALGAEQVQGQPKGIFTLQPPEVDLTKLPTTYASRLFGRDKEMAGLVDAWDRGVARVIAYDAMGGTGKTALIYHFVQHLKTTGWRGARAIFAWSFYSQGSNEDRQTDADEFFKTAIRFLEKNPEAEVPDDPRDKGLALAELVKKQRCLIILDGLEPLQYAAGSSGGAAKKVGGIKDPGILALLQKLADVNPGLCIVTTRIALREFTGNAGVLHETLEQLPVLSGIALLRSLGVEPAAPYDTHCLAGRESVEHHLAVNDVAVYREDNRLGESLRDAVSRLRGPGDAIPDGETREEMAPSRTWDLIRAVVGLGGHALALNLVGNFIREQYNGDIRGVDQLPGLEELGDNAPERDPYRVMRAIEIALKRRIEEEGKLERPADSAAGRQLALLFFLGFFDRPAEIPLMEEVFADDGSEAENEAVEAGDEDVRFHRALFVSMYPYTTRIGKLRTALSELARQGLVSKMDEDVRWEKAEIDCHPLVREYFGQRLREVSLETYRAAHGRLYDFYRYQGLPKEFQEPVAYAVLALVSAYPQIKEVFLSTSEAEEWPEGWIEVLPPTLISPDWEKVNTAAKLLDAPVWDRAWKAFLPGTEKGMVPIFSAVGHGCLAGREEEAFNEVYWPRVSRGNEAFATKKLGLHGLELAAVASFFEEPFRLPNAHLSEARRALVLGLAGFLLRAIGRLEDSIDAMRAAMLMRVKLEDWRQASIAAGNLCELLIMIGKLDPDREKGAVTVGREAVAYADRSGNIHERLDNRKTFGNALFQSGGIDGEVGNWADAGKEADLNVLVDAECLFRRSEQLQADFQPEVPQLYSMGGFLYGELLLSRGRVREVARRGAELVEFYKTVNVTLSDYSLGNFQVAKARLAAAQVSSTPGPDFDFSHEGFLPDLRRANQEPLIVAGLLTAAELVLFQAELLGSATPEIRLEFDQLIKEAEGIAERGPMGLFSADAKLLHTRWEILHRAVEDARRFRDMAAELIGEHHYGKAGVELAVVDAELAAIREDLDDSARTDAILAACCAVEEKGVWGLIWRIEALSGDAPEIAEALERLSRKRAAYDANRDEHLEQEEKRVAEILAKRQSEERESIGATQVPDELVEVIFSNEEIQPVIRQLLEANDIPSDDLDALPMELKRQVATILIQQSGK